MSKFGVSYNVFDGEELLEASIKSIRESVDYISVVYQTTSNYGNPCDDGLVPLLEKLKDDGLVDELMKYIPQGNGHGHANEITKRNLGLHLSKRAKCDYHMSMDTDEFYTKEQFEFMKRELVDGDYDTSACQMVTYYKSPKYRLEPKEDYYVSLFCKIDKDTQYKFGIEFPVLVDPTRRTDSGKCRIFTRDEIEMHHMSYVRKNIETKLKNSSALGNFNNVQGVIDHYNNWEPTQQALFAGSPDKLSDVVETEELFRVEF